MSNNNADSEEVSNLIFITGGARSGKSVFAESLAERYGDNVVYLATMERIEDDRESIERIEKHQRRRSQSWKLIESPYDVHRQLTALDDSTTACCLIDCLSLYVSNILLRFSMREKSDIEIEHEVDEAIDLLLQAMRRQEKIKFVAVTNEVTWGVVPENKLARLYRDLLGSANQRVARSAGEVWLSCVGLQIPLKPHFAVAGGK